MYEGRKILKLIAISSQKLREVDVQEKGYAYLELVYGRE